MLQILPTQSEEHSAASSNTPLGDLKPESESVPSQDEAMPNVDPQLQRFFAKRRSKILDPNALDTFEKTVQARMAINRGNAQKKEDGKENLGDRGVDSELFKKLQKQKNKITQN